MDKELKKYLLYILAIDIVLIVGAVHHYAPKLINVVGM